MPQDIPNNFQIISTLIEKNFVIKLASKRTSLMWNFLTGLGPILLILSC